MDRLSVLLLHLLLSLQSLQRLLWWILELHIVKITSCYIIWVCVKEVCVLNLLFVVCVSVALPCRPWRPRLAGVCTVWTCTLAVCKMLYQLNAVQPIGYSSNCTMPGNSSTHLSHSALYSGPVDPARWVGFKKTDGKLLDYLRYNLMMLALLAFEVTVYRHQELYRLHRNEVPPPTRTLFHDITRHHLDDGVLSCTKYFLNYFFYKFGLETCFLLAVNVIGQRMDLFAVGHAFGLISVLSQRSRKSIAAVWPKYCYFLSGALCFQYLLCIGFPPAACTDYPWRPPSSNMDSNVVKWLFLPDHLTPPNPIFLLYDFLLLLGASLQLQVFEEELQPEVQLLAGENSELYDGQVSDPIRSLRLNTGLDFMLCRSYLDMMKISIFCMGYLVACFYFLLVGGDLLLKPADSILRYWDCLIGYNVFSLVLNHCWLIQLFSLACTIKGYTKPEQQSSKQCELPSDEAGIIWDGVCFCFLLLQRRVFRSNYFLYVVLDLQNTQLLASRGAELFEASTVKAVRARLEVEKTSMDLLKRQMERIKSRQQKFRRGKEKLLSLTQDSFSAEGPENRKKKWWRPWVNHASMVRKICLPVCVSHTVLRRFSYTMRFCWVLLSALLDSLTAWLRGLCQEHIDISTVLRIEHCMLTQQAKQGNVPTRDAIHVYYQRQILKASRESGLNYSSHEAEGQTSAERGPEENPETQTVPDGEGPIFILLLVFRPGPDESGLQEGEGFGERSDFLSDSTSCPAVSRAQDLTASDLTFYDEQLEASDRFYADQHQLLQICYALYNILAARSETVCFLVIVLNHMVSASCLTLVLPVLVFLWATLSVPRPSKTFWMTAIIYTEVTIVIKYFFQFGFFPFNKKLEVDRSKPFHPPNILGVEKKEAYVLYDLLQLLALFYHRAILKCHGLWDQTVTTETETLHPSVSQLDSGSASIDPSAPVLRRRVRRRTRSSSTQLRSPAGSLSSKVLQPSRVDLLLEKLRELSIRAKRHSVSRCMSLYLPVLQFFRALVQPEYSAVTDVYVLMFLCDTVDFIVIVFGFWAFGKHSAAADITSSLSEDQVPEAFLVMVLIQFGTMVIDRALYLRKTVLGKLVFQVFLVFGIHFWMFFILPTVTERRFNQNLVAQLWYFVKCVYFGLSAYQIRSGYPTRVLGNFLTKSHNYLNLFLFQGFRLVPFLTELRAVMDWVWTDTTLSLSSWICVEDVYAHCFVLKCWRESEKRYPQPRGQKKKRVVKYGMGGLIVLLLICIVWFPLLFMSLVKSVAGVNNRPIDVSLTITLGGFQPIFTMSAQQNQLRDLTEDDFSSFSSSYSTPPIFTMSAQQNQLRDLTEDDFSSFSSSYSTPLARKACDKPRVRPCDKPRVRPCDKPRVRPCDKPRVRPCDKPRVRPCDKPRVRPCDKPRVRPCDKPRVRPCDKPRVRPCDKPRVRPCDKPRVRPCDKPRVRPCDKPRVRPCDKPFVRPCDKPCVRPCDKPRVRPCDKPRVRPCDKPRVRPCDKPRVRPCDKPRVRPCDKPRVRPCDKPRVRPCDKPRVRPCDKPWVRPCDKPRVRACDKPQVRPCDKPRVRPCDKPRVRPCDKPRVRPCDKSRVRPCDKPQVKPCDKPRVRPCDKPRVRPCDKPRVRPCDKPRERRGSKKKTEHRRAVPFRTRFKLELSSFSKQRKTIVLLTRIEAKISDVICIWAKRISFLIDVGCYNL
ncbi:hypothetical protein JOQ06_028222 [Pogonophryne albipinna]|uniref:Piezo-type mechanosensitive ion channel component n=1 Tax=Pogonophryne albipinna TaxID=1090488 RepID=A0AAD6F7U5_9TELE|nr:hypothetical protein JOQ06_028222 [Pogonophryne albipinna]